MNKTRVNNPFRPVYPSPAGLICSIDSAGKANIMTAGEIFNIGLKNPCIIGIALRPATYSHSLICESREFTVNLPTAAILDAVDQIGTVSGRDGLDKFSAFGLTPLDSAEIKTPIIAECPVNLECKVLEITTVGDHDLFLGEVVAMHVDTDKLDEKQRVRMDLADPFSFSEWGYYRFGEKINDIGYMSGGRERSRK
ncbi:MAG: flavin reductase family protein [Defluviitaleaceae bacterium]|nr:flavin reductase family protein [Defluviitaleaceae bacterium]